jgi:hypothetical protein
LLDRPGRGQSRRRTGTQPAPRSLSGLQIVSEQRQPASGDTLAGHGNMVYLVRLDGMTTQITCRPGTALWPPVGAAHHHGLTAIGAQLAGWLFAQVAQPVSAEGYKHAERVIVERVHSVRPEVQQGQRPLGHLWVHGAELGVRIWAEPGTGAIHTWHISTRWECLRRYRQRDRRMIMRAGR